MQMLKASWVLFLFVMGYWLNGPGLVSAQQTASISSSANCLFVNNINSKVNILELGAPDGVPVTNVTLRPKLSITNVGYNPTGWVSSL